MHYFLGIKMSQQKEKEFIAQKKYTKLVLEKLRINNYKLVTTPHVANIKLNKEDRFEKADNRLYRSLIGSLLYLLLLK